MRRYQSSRSGWSSMRTCHVSRIPARPPLRDTKTSMSAMLLPRDLDAHGGPAPGDRALFGGVAPEPSTRGAHRLGGEPVEPVVRAEPARGEHVVPDSPGVLPGESAELF